MDKISLLPDDILHNIMSRLHHREAVRTAVLSKSWRQTFSTFPYLLLDEDHDAFIHSKQPNSFYLFAENSLLRFLNQGLTLKKLQLFVDSTNYTKALKLLYPSLDYWIGLAKDCAVEVLQITMHNNNYRDIDHSVLSPYMDYCGNLKRYPIPSTLLEAKSLVKLILNGCILLDDQVFLNHPITFSSLKVLSLCDVHIENTIIFHKLLASCPLVEYITLDSCVGIDPVVSIHGLSKLKEVRITAVKDFEIEEIEIDAPSLENFYYSGANYTDETKFKMDKCVNLNHVSLSRFSIVTGDQWFLQHHLFTLMHTLELRKVHLPERINMSLPQLRVLKLDNCDGGRDDTHISVNTPKLHLFTYISSQFNKIELLNCSSQLEIHVELSFYWVLNYEKVREFFQQFEGTSVSSATLSFFNIQSIHKLNTDVLECFSLPPPAIKHLHLRFTSERIVSFPIVTSLLWTCRPSIISCSLSHRTLVKVLCEALMNRKSKEECYCSASRDMKLWWEDYKKVKSTFSSSGFFKEILIVFSNHLKEILFESLLMRRPSHVKCWWHDLKDVKVIRSLGIDGKETSVDWKDFLYALPNLSEGNVSFVLG